MSRETRHQLLALGGLIAALAGAHAVRAALGLEWSAESVRGVVEGFGLWGPLVLVALLTFRSLIVIPSQILLVAGGVCFGAAAGAAYGALGMTLAGIGWFGLARFVGRDTVMARIPPALRPTFDAASRTMGAAFVLLATAYPFGPMTAWHAGAGLTHMAFATFAAALAAGAVLRAAMYTYFGSRLIDAEPAEVILAGAVLLGFTVVPLLFPPLRRRVRAMLNLQAPPAAAGDPGATAGAAGSAPSRRGTTGSAPR